MTRLIDVDALSKDLEKRWNVNDDQDFCNKEVWHALEEAPTIEPNGDLISRQDAIDALAKFVPYAIDDMSTESYTNGLTDAYNLICQLPSADAVKVVRCMNCIYGEERIEDYRCRKLDEGWDIRFKPTHFCSYGERREP